MGSCHEKEVENSPIIEADTRAGLENSREGRQWKKAVIGGVWCLSNAERLVMIPLAAHNERKRESQKECDTVKKEEAREAKTLREDSHRTLGGKTKRTSRKRIQGVHYEACSPQQQ